MDLVAYLRVSRIGEREGDSFQSPEEQRRAIAAIVNLTDEARVIAECEDLDESGGSMNRPGVRRAIAMVDNGQADGIVCAYLDRWARNMEALEMIERWTKQGKTFISARERFDASTSAGRFTLGMMLLVAKYYRDRITETWDASVRNAVERGVHVTVPYGYRRGDGNGKAHRKGGARGAPLVVYEPEAGIVLRIFEERRRGAGAAAIADGLNAEGVPSPRGGRWTRQAVRALLRVRAYTGEARRGEYAFAQAHEAIVSPEEWRVAQTERGQPRRTNHSLLVRLARCGGCGYVMGAGSSRAGRRYNCGRHHAELQCPEPTTAPAESLEAFVVERFLKRYGAIRMSGAPTEDPSLAAAEAAVHRARAEYRAWRDDVDLRAQIGDADYREGVLARKAAVTDADRAHRDAIRRNGAGGLSIDERVWASLDLEQRRELLRAGVDAVVLRRARSTSTPLPNRVDIIWAGELDHDGTRAGAAAAVREHPRSAGVLISEDAG